MSFEVPKNGKWRHSPHPWNKPYSRTCIAVDCDNPVYWDGEVFYSCCLACLEKKQLGPFRARLDPVGYD